MPGPDDGRLDVRMAGEPLVALAERALYWPARRRLVIADLHLGKEHVFRRAGIAVPHGVTQDDLQRLSQLLGSTGALSLWIVGDLLHGPSAPAGWKDAWRAWRQRHEAVDVAVLAGNHDRWLARAGLDVRLLGEVHSDGPFLFRHVPRQDPGGKHVIAGHVHPKARVSGLPRSWPVFWMKEGVTVLPAFSEFTGGHLVKTDAQSALLACVGGELVALPRGGTHSDGR
ncbi:ligase-associated DNA damage response endonuclease PdeM [Pusillimonas caeni]|uniref:ligase-associated DNA damage response endonuclease PdeM n=1 Tax=Pusillimonas caeni TaxID=1348472 RepID=UPI000E599150|nr:ligase-associated DNA damage response endonuclease PdeM [Pusillimonas caeni]TFL15351.1 ligase-associated DNA damage response endonuclease PdeM [Pusillimonas caeni]